MSESVKLLIGMKAGLIIRSNGFECLLNLAEQGSTCFLRKGLPVSHRLEVPAHVFNMDQSQSFNIQ